jgi:anti-anti-sigma regulatory factor
VIEVSHHPAAVRTSAVIVVDLRQSSTTDFAPLLDCAIGAGAGEVSVVVDLGARPDASSELLTVLHRCSRRLRAHGGRLAVACSRPELRRLFDVTLLSQGFDVYASRAEALRAWA